MLGINDWDFLYHLINNNSSMYGSKRETQKQTGKRSNFMKNIEHFIGNFIYYMRNALCCVCFNFKFSLTFSTKKREFIAKHALSNQTKRIQ